MILESISLSSTLLIQQSRDIGRYEDGWLVGLLGFGMGMMSALRQREGKEFVSHDVLKMSVQAWIALGPRCFRWMFVMRSGPAALELDKDLIVRDTAAVEKGGGAWGSIFRALFMRVILRLDLAVGLKLIRA